MRNVARSSRAQALDAFLEGVLDFEPSVVRVGGRSKSEKLAHCNLRDKTYELRELDKQCAQGSLFGAQHVRARRSLVARLRDLEEAAGRLCADATQAAAKGPALADLDDLATPDQVRSLFSRPVDNDRVLETWLEANPSEVLKAEDTAAKKKVKDEVSEKADNPDALNAAAVRADEVEDAGGAHAEGRGGAARERPGVMAIPAPPRLNPRLGPHQQSRKQRRGMQHAPPPPPPGLRARPPPPPAANHFEGRADVWSLAVSERRALFVSWAASLYDDAIRGLASAARRYERSRRELDRLDRDVEAEVLRASKVVGLTTTAVAKRRELLEAVEPQVVVVEEAAEVLEAHVLAALGNHTKHVVLIGDHEQLRPGTAVFRLATRYNLDVSLFERLVKNGVEHVTLETQRRMRPNMSRLVRSIYPNLQDHDSVRALPLVRCVHKNLFFVDHAMREEGDASKCNPGEARLVAAVARYLVEGPPRYATSQVTVLATYVAQVGLLKRELAKLGLDDVRVSSVDNFQGEENAIILLSLVRNDGNAGKRDHGHSSVGFLAVSNRACVSLTRARSGLFIFGNAPLLASKSALWRSITDDLRKDGALGAALPLDVDGRGAPTHHVASDRDVDAVLGASSRALEL